MVCVSSHFDGVSVCFLGNKDTHLYVFSRSDHPCLCVSSHFDGIRALVFHPVEPVLITAAEDHMLKLWNLQKTVPAKRSVQPLHPLLYHALLSHCAALYL